MLSMMKTDTYPSVPAPGHPYFQLQQQVHEALLRQHPEWVQPNGESPICEAYELRLAKLLGLPSLSEYRSAA
jgi:hypothetical protein